MSERAETTEQSKSLEAEKHLELVAVSSLFHGILFAYQKSVREILGTGHAVFVHPTLTIIKEIKEKIGVNLVKGENIDEAFRNLSEIMRASGFVGEYRLQKLAPQKYILYVDNCTWAEHIHDMLKPKDVTCPLALIAMVVFEEFTKGKIKVADSKYTATGTMTPIELIED